MQLNQSGKKIWLQKLKVTGYPALHLFWSANGRWETDISIAGTGKKNGHKSHIYRTDIMVSMSGNNTVLQGQHDKVHGTPAPES